MSVFPSDADGDRQDAAPTRIQKALVDFVMDFHLDNVFIYRYVPAYALQDTSDISSETRYVKMCSSSSTTAISTLRTSSHTTKNWRIN